MTVIITLLAFGLIILVHEFGHFVAARLAGIRVQEFSVGFGPALAQIKRGATIYSLRLLLPFGGYVRLAGMDPSDVSAAEPGSYQSKPVLARMAVMASGSVMNLALAVVLFSIVYGAIGLPVPTLTVDTVLGDRPAAVAGMRPGDRIVSIDGRQMADWGSLVTAVRESGGSPLTIVVERDQEEVTLIARPELEDGRPVLGIQPAISRERSGPVNALVRGFSDTFLTIGMWFASLFLMATGQLQGDLIGAIGVAQVIGVAATIGVDTVLLVVAQICVIVGVVNLLPIPMLDGSRLVFLAIEGVRGRPVDFQYEQMIHLVGLAFLMFLTVFLVYRDLSRILGGQG